MVKPVVTAYRSTYPEKAAERRLKTTPKVSHWSTVTHTYDPDVFIKRRTNQGPNTPVEPPKQRIRACLQAANDRLKEYPNNVDEYVESGDTQCLLGDVFVLRRSAGASENEKKQEFMIGVESTVYTRCHLDFSWFFHFLTFPPRVHFMVP